MKSSNSKQRKYNIIAGALLFVMMFPGLWMFSGKKIVRPLDGAFILSEKPDLSSLSAESWMEGSFQAAFEKGLKEHVGFHDFFVRMCNSIDFLLFKKVSAEGVIRGKEQQFFEYDYIRAMEGIDYLGEDILDRQIRRLKFVQEELKKYNTEMVFVFEPSKARFFAEYIPDRYAVVHDKPTNYSKSLELCQKYNLEYIDLNQFFLDEKSKHDYPLYTKYGIHWSVYGMYQALDTLTSYLREECDVYIPTLEVVDITATREPRDTDFDLGYLMNLLINPECEVMGYPIGKVTHDEDNQKPGILAVGDSYYLNILHNSDAKKLFRNQHFWYYNKHVYPEQYEKESLVHDLNLKQELVKADVLLVAVTERFLYKNLWGFADDAFEAFSVTSQDEQFFTGVNEILSTDGWFSNLIDDAHNKNIPLSEVLEANADYLVYLNNRDLYLRHYGTAYFEKNIRNDINWFDKIKAIAEKDNIPVEKVLYDVAEHEFEKNHPAIYEEWKFKSDLKKRIISSSDWLSVVRDKAERKYLSLDEMMDIDAEYLWQMHLKQNSSPQ